MPQIARNGIERTGTPAVINSPGRFFLCLGLLFGGHALLRSFLSPTANLDEAEQLMLTQDWALGYGPQPPLYTWLQACVFQVLGISIFSLALLKNALLFCTYALAYLIAKLITGRHGAGVLASLMLLFIPQIAWESQRDLTHSVLAATTSLAVLSLLLKCQRSGQLRWYLLFGLVVACGALAKYNFLLWAVGLMAAAASLPAFREAILNRRMALAVGIAATIVTPHAIWALKNPERVAQTVSKLHLAQEDSVPIRASHDLWASARAAVLARAQGVGNLVSAVARFLGPLLGILAVLCWGVWPCLKQKWRAHEEVKLLARALACIGVLLLMFILLFGVTGFKDRWFQPILVVSPVLLTIWAYDCCRQTTLRIICWLALGVVVTVALFIPGKVLLGEKTGRQERLNFPLAKLGQKLGQIIDSGDAIVTDTPFLAGNLRLALPGRRVTSKLWGYENQQSVWVVWDARKLTEPPKELFRIGGSTFVPAGEPMLLSAPLRNQPSKTYVLGAVRAQKRDDLSAQKTKGLPFGQPL